MAGKAGLEPATLGLEDRCSIQLSYLPFAKKYIFFKKKQEKKCNNKR